jgi:amidase
MSSTFITRLDATGSGPRVAVKDLIDVAGVPTTAGSRALERTAGPATRDAGCLAGSREADARLVGKANLHELAMLPIGTNPWFGTPVNPIDPALIPGGSSSGSAVAVADDEADVALGSDTGGSVRIPAACCGISGLKTTHGRVPLDGVWPLARSLDTIGPMATDIAGLTLGMTLLEPGFNAGPERAQRIGRLRTSGDPLIEAAIDSALRTAEFEIVTLDWDGFGEGVNCFTSMVMNGIGEADRDLIASHPDEVGADIHEMFEMVELFHGQSADVLTRLEAWRRSLFALFDQVELLALPTLPIFPPRLDEVAGAILDLALELTCNVALFNAAGVPACAQPVFTKGSDIPASLQLVGPRDGEELILATAATVEAAAGQWR